MFLAVTSRDSTGAGTLAVTDNDTGGNAWAKIGNSTDHKATLWYKRATSGTASKTVTVSNTVGSASGVLKAFSGGDTGATPYTDVTVETNASGDETAAGITPDLADCMLCASIHNYGNDNAVTSLSSATYGALTQTEKLSTGGSDCACAFGHVLTSGSSASGNTTWAQTNGAGYSISWFVKPAPEERTGTLAATDPVDTASFAGDVIVQGSLSVSEGTADTASFAGDVIVSGSFALSEGAADTASFSGTVASGEISGSLAATDALDTASVAGTVLVSGALAASDAVDTVAFEGTVADPPVIGSFDLTDEPDIAAIVAVAANAESEDLDTASFTGTLVTPVMPIPEAYVNISEISPANLPTATDLADYVAPIMPRNMYYATDEYTVREKGEPIAEGINVTFDNGVTIYVRSGTKIVRHTYIGGVHKTTVHTRKRFR